MKVKFNKGPMYISSGIDLLISAVVCTTGILINRKFLKVAEEDEKHNSSGSIVNPVMILNTRMLMINIPLLSFLFWLVHQELDVPEWLQYLSCYDQYISAIWRLFFGFNSLVIAVMRYTFIVHHDKVLIFGKETAKKMFFHASYSIPIVIGIFNAFFVPTPPNARNPIQSVCLYYYQEVLNITCSDPVDYQDNCSPVLSMTHSYVPLEVIRILGIVVKILVSLIFSNFLEGFIYVKTFLAMKR